jgi:sialic acid synthase SpsE
MKLIAEVGSNWRTYDDLFKSVEMAKEDGADAIKFQYFTGEELYGQTVSAVDKYSVPLTALKQLKQICRHYDIEFMCSAFSLQGYKDIDPLVETHKVASSEATWPHVINTVLEMRKDVVVSVGGLSRSQIKKIVLNWDKFSCHNLTLLYCDPTYPSTKSQRDVVEGVKSLLTYNVDVGLSDHSRLIYWPVEVLGYLHVYEKHYNPLDLSDTPDAPHSATREQFVALARQCRNSPTIYTYNPHQRRENLNWFRPYFPGE